MLNKNNKLNDENLSTISGGYGSNSSIDENLNKMMSFIDQLGGAYPSFEQKSKVTSMQKVTLQQYKQQLCQMSYQLRINNGQISPEALKNFKYVTEAIDAYLG